MKINAGLVGILAGLPTLGWLGLRVRPAPFPPFGQPQPSLRRMPLPGGLPAPVERFYRQIYGGEMPVVESAVITGRASMRVGGITFPGRFRFTHLAGQAYRHYIETTWFGLPVLKVNESYLGGVGRMELPFGVSQGPGVDQAANLGLWGESMWLPSIYLGDPRVRWEPVDQVTSLLVVPFGEREERFVVRFDLRSGLPRLMEAMRHKDIAGEAKTLWLVSILEWGSLGGNPAMTRTAVTWFDEGTPWATFNAESVVYNVDVRETIRARGP